MSNFFTQLILSTFFLSFKPLLKLLQFKEYGYSCAWYERRNICVNTLSYKLCELQLLSVFKCGCNDSDLSIKVFNCHCNKWFYCYNKHQYVWNLNKNTSYYIDCVSFLSHTQKCLLPSLYPDICTLYNLRFIRFD